MSDFENGCAGSCDACGSKSDCEKATVTLTLDDGSMMECAILTIFEADEKEPILSKPTAFQRLPLSSLLFSLRFLYSLR